MTGTRKKWVLLIITIVATARKWAVAYVTAALPVGYGKYGAQADQSAQLGRQDRPASVIVSPASIWTRSTIRRRMGLKGPWRTHHAYIA